MKKCVITDSKNFLNQLCRKISKHVEKPAPQTGGLNLFFGIHVAIGENTLQKFPSYLHTYCRGPVCLSTKPQKP